MSDIPRASVEMTLRLSLRRAPGLCADCDEAISFTLRALREIAAELPAHELCELLAMTPLGSSFRVSHGNVRALARDVSANREISFRGEDFSTRLFTIHLSFDIARASVEMTLRLSLRGAPGLCAGCDEAISFSLRALQEIAAELPAHEPCELLAMTPTWTVISSELPRS